MNIDLGCLCYWFQISLARSRPRTFDAAHDHNYPFRYTYTFMQAQACKYTIELRVSSFILRASMSSPLNTSSRTASWWSLSCPVLEVEMWDDSPRLASGVLPRAFFTFFKPACSEIVCEVKSGTLGFAQNAGYSI